MNRYRFFRFLSRVVLKVCFRVEVRGLENIPPEGPFIIAPNHISFIDPVAAGAFIERDLHYMARDTLFTIPLLGRLIRWCNAFPVSRTSPGPGAVRRALSILKAGGGLLVFPEGRRSPDGRLGEGTPGVGMLSAMAESPVVPVLITGSDRALPVGAVWIRFAGIKVYFCAPVRPPRDGSRRDYRNIADEVISAIRRKMEEEGQWRPG